MMSKGLIVVRPLRIAKAGAEWLDTSLDHEGTQDRQIARMTLHYCTASVLSLVEFD